MKKIIILGIILTIFIQLPLFAIEDTKQAKKLHANLNITVRKYLLGPNDVISIYVQDFSEYNREKIRIQPDGNIIVAPFGVLSVAGITMDELYYMLNEKYLEYFKKPQITIKLEKTKPFIVYVAGAVVTPGSYELSSDTERNNNGMNAQKGALIERKTPLLSNILIAAGGIKYDADLEHIQISNPLDGSKIEVNLFDLITNKEVSQDVYLMSYDTIYVPKLQTPFAIDEEKYKKFVKATFSPKNTPVKVLGYVKNPGLVLLDNSQSLNLNSAISKAGGYSTDLQHPPKKVYLSRLDNNGKLVTKVINPMNKEIVLMPNDVVYIPEKKRTTIVKAFDHVTRVINPVNIFANSYNNWALMFDPTRYQVVGK